MEECARRVREDVGLRLSMLGMLRDSSGGGRIHKRKDRLRFRSKNIRTCEVPDGIAQTRRAESRARYASVFTTDFDAVLAHVGLLCHDVGGEEESREDGEHCGGIHGNGVGCLIRGGRGSQCCKVFSCNGLIRAVRAAMDGELCVWCLFGIEHRWFEYSLVI